MTEQKKGPHKSATRSHSAFTTLPYSWQERSQKGRGAVPRVKAHLLVDLLQEHAESGCSLTMVEIIKRFKAAGFTPADAHNAVERMTTFGELLLEANTGQMHVALVRCQGGDE